MDKEKLIKQLVDEYYDIQRIITAEQNKRFEGAVPAVTVTGIPEEVRIYIYKQVKAAMYKEEVEKRIRG